MFPGAHASVITNEAGEPLGWDYPSYDEPPGDDDDDLRAYFDEVEADDDAEYDDDEERTFDYSL